MKSIIACCAVVLLLPVVGLAQEVTGTYHGYGQETTTIELPDGRSLNRSTSHIFMAADDSDSSLNQGKGSCMSEGVVSESGGILDAAGACVVRNGGGDTYWFWWRLTDGGTETCPISCGTWGIFNGTGVFAGATGSGTWKTTTLYPDGTDAGAWTMNAAEE